MKRMNKSMKIKTAVLLATVATACLAVAPTMLAKSASAEETVAENITWTKEDLYNVLPAVCYFFIRLREVLPNAEIYGIANHLRMKQEIINAISHVCGYIGGKAVILQNIETESSHPSIKGMIQIKNQVLDVFDQN